MLLVLTSISVQNDVTGDSRASGRNEGQQNSKGICMPIKKTNTNNNNKIQ